MSVKFEPWALAPPSWVTTPGPDLNGVVLSSRIRLARNLENIPFPHNSSLEIQKKVLKEVMAASESLPTLKNSIRINFNELGPLEKNFLMERQLISQQHAQSRGERGLIVTSGESISIMVNEEDHIRSAAFEPGLNLEEAWQKIFQLDSEFQHSLRISFDNELGYITTCPTNVGTGLRASCLMHLPGLSMVGKIEELTEYCRKNGLVLRGFYGEGSQAWGHLYQVSNSITLGITEKETFNNVSKVVKIIAQSEKRTQKELQSGPQETQTEDLIYRSLGTLKTARLLNFDEGMFHISIVRFGKQNGTEISVDLSDLTDLFFLMQPAHLLLRFKAPPDSIQDKKLRAEYLRKALKLA